VSLRITAGLFRNLPLIAPKGRETRPTSAMVREAVMNILGERVLGASVLDLYAGSGAMGLEALSRGAAKVLLGDSSPASFDAMASNQGRLPEGARASVKLLRLSLPAQIPALVKFGPFDLVFLDPPYREWRSPIESLIKLSQGAALSPGALAVWEQDARTPENWTEAELGPWGLRSLRRWGGKAAAFLEFSGGGDAEGEEKEAAEGERAAALDEGLEEEEGQEGD
jgi:16S rRNA (guanine(966)-N(2))-methyltransferase RsmD